jgi:hypothetical protein
MIVICGIASEAPIAMVSAALDRLGQPFAVLHQRRFAETPIDIDIADGHVGGRMVVDGHEIDCATVTGIYTRLIDWRALPEINGAPVFDRACLPVLARGLMRLDRARTRVCDEPRQRGFVELVEALPLT